MNKHGVAIIDIRGNMMKRMRSSIIYSTQ